MNRLVIIGNGFDLAHGLKTSYKDFIDWYLEKRLKELRHEHTYLSSDELCTFTLPKDETWHSLMFQFPWETGYSFENFWNHLETSEYVKIEYSPLFARIITNKIEKGWVDIENDYYTLLKLYKDKPEYICELNKQLQCVQDNLIEYLSSINSPTGKKRLHDYIINFIDPEDLSCEGKNKALEDVKGNTEDERKWRPDEILILSFNYTNTIEQYYNYNVTINYIHGQVSTPQKVIFGYGDELDRDYRDLVDRNDNELLRFSKSSKYLEADNYRKLLQFLESRPFQVLIMGHSCGNSDRTLLNTIFEHRNCVSIKPFYYKKQDGTDNYLELVQNISRNFTDMKLFRDRVVNKTRCKTM